MLTNKKLFLLDMDGTLYLGDKLFDGTINFLNKIKNSGGRYLFLTNNSSKSTQVYINKLEKLGIKATEDDFVTSTFATSLYINANYPEKKFYGFGTQSFIEELRKNGIIITTELDEDVFGIVMGNDSELTFKKLDDTCKLLTERKCVYIATNPDWLCPTEYGYVPDCGSVAEMIFRATGQKPVFIGKPKPEMINLSLEKFGYDKSQAVMVGDRIYTDIASGFNAGIDTILVLSGESTLRDVDESEVKPTYVFESIKDIINLI